MTAARFFSSSNILSLMKNGQSGGFIGLLESRCYER